MVVQRGDTCKIPNPEKFIGDSRTIEWSQKWGREMSVVFCFIPFICSRDKSGSFIAVELNRLEEFKQLCKKAPVDPDDWTSYIDAYHFTVDYRFKYGQDNEQTWRFLVFQNPDYKPYQQRFTKAADMGFKVSLGNDLHSF
ncbi:unnamed protein product [Umbelopsis ramanniana]